MKKDDLILVVTINVAGMTGEEAYILAQEMKKEFVKPESEGISWIFIPTYDGQTKVECINPVLLSEELYQSVKEKTERYEEMLSAYLDQDTIIEPCTNCGFVEGTEIDNIPKEDWKPIAGETVGLVKEDNWLSRIVQALADFFYIEPIKLIDESNLTCDQCIDKEACEYSGDPYNTDGDCLAAK